MYISSRIREEARENFVRKKPSPKLTATQLNTQILEAFL